MRSPERLDARSLQLHQLIAQKVRAHPELFARVPATLRHWRGTVDARTMPYIDRWDEIVSRGMEAALAVATEDSEDARALRQASPFCGILTHKERASFFRNWRWDR